MIKSVPLYRIILLAIILLSSCTEIEYNNPIDPKGINASIISANPDALADDNNDGILNIEDSSWLKAKDTIPPVITLNGGDTITILKMDEANKLQMYTDTSNKALISISDLPENRIQYVSVNSDDVNTFKVNDGTNPYRIIYTVSDFANNTTTAIRYVIVTAVVSDDKDPPILTIGDSIRYININTPFEEPGYSAYDVGDGAEAEVTITGTVDITTPGTYVLTYIATDSKNNSISLKRTIIVSDDPLNDVTPPQITLKGEDTLTFKEGETIDEFKARYVEPGFTATDDVDGDITNKVRVSEIKQLSLAFYYITYDVTDEAGNSAEQARRIVATGMKETNILPPEIILVYGDSVLQQIINTRWKEPGFAVIDPQDGTIPNSQVIVDSSNLVANLTTLGDYVVTYTVKNSLGITTVKERHIQVVLSKNDRQKPVITLVGKNPDTCLVQSKYTDPGYTAEDDRDGDITEKVVINGTVNTSKIGSNTLLYSVQDSAGNRSEVTTRIVWVVWDTLTTNLLVRYNVPSPDPLPSISIKETSFLIDGEGPDLESSNLTAIEFKWIFEPNNKQFQFYMTYSSAPHHQDLKGKTRYAFDKAEPNMKLSGTLIDGLDGNYYVTIWKKKLVWVQEDGDYAIIFGGTEGMTLGGGAAEEEGAGG